MDRHTFLFQILNIENVVQANEGEECLICRERYGTPSSEIGEIERQIRLPCDPKHTVGSSCIATWLQEHNTCPICRHELFPAPEIEYDDDDENEDDSEEEQDIGVGLPEMQYLCQSLCDDLGFEVTTDHPIRVIACQVAKRVWYTDIILAEPTYEENYNLAGACVYMASHLVRRRLRLRDIVSVSPLNREGITAAYWLLDEQLDEIVDEDLCRRIGTGDVESVLRRLPKVVRRESREGTVPA